MNGLVNIIYEARGCKIIFREVKAFEMSGLHCSKYQSVNGVTETSY